MRKSCESPSSVLVGLENEGKLLSLNTALRIEALEPGWEKPGWFCDSRLC